MTQTLNRNAKVYVYCTFLPTRHPALTPSPCQLDCCSQSRIDQKLLRAADKTQSVKGKKAQKSQSSSPAWSPESSSHKLLITHLRTHVKVQRFRAQLQQGRHGTETQRPRTNKQKRDSQAGASKVSRGASVSAKVQTGVHNFRLRKLEKLSVRRRTDVGESDVGGTGRKGETAKGLG